MVFPQNEKSRSDGTKLRWRDFEIETFMLPEPLPQMFAAGAPD